MNTRARRGRRILRDHRRDHATPLDGRAFGHSVKLADLGGGASVHGWWMCARCVANDRESDRIVASLTETARQAYLAGEMTLRMAAAVSRVNETAPAALEVARRHHRRWEDVKAELRLRHGASVDE